MLYGRSDIQGITVSETGHRHDRKKGQDGPFVLDCPECEAAPTIVLSIRDPKVDTDNTKSWARSREHAPLTEQEIAARDAAREQMLLGQMSEFEEFRAWQRARRAGAAPA